MKLSLFAIALLVSLIALASARAARIDFLLHEVETAKGVTFICNGAEHDTTAASQHLRKKLRYAGERVQTAGDFIKYCASESSLTHEKSRLRLPDGKTPDASEYLNNKLRV